MAYLASAIFFLYESRISLGRDRWRLYISFGLASGLLCCYSAIPSLITYFVKGEIISDSLAETLLTLSLAVFIISKLMLIPQLYDDKRANIVEKIIAWNEQRRADIGDSDLTVAEPEQLSFELIESESTADNEPKEAETDTNEKDVAENEEDTCN